MMNKIGLRSLAMLITKIPQKTSCGMFSWLSLLDYTSMGLGGAAYSLLPFPQT